ncbi:MAG: hypothetical protein FJ033_15035, partial [Chloroflexi bacterium]|nr:hypothetical protein [Chloroflexota bacterium]
MLPSGPGLTMSQRNRAFKSLHLITLLAMMFGLLPPFGPTAAGANGINYRLQGTTVVLGSTTFGQVTTTTVTESLQTASASIGSPAVVTLNNSGVSTFVFDEVPSGQTYDLGGDWIVKGYLSASGIGGTGTFEVTLSKVNAAGTVTPLYTLFDPTSTNVLGTTTPTLRTLTNSVPTTYLYQGERWALSFNVAVSVALPGGTVSLGYNTSAQPSGVEPIYRIVGGTPTPGAGTQVATALSTSVSTALSTSVSTALSTSVSTALSTSVSTALST